MASGAKRRRTSPPFAAMVETGGSEEMQTMDAAQARAEAEKKAVEEAAESIRKAGEQAAKNLEEKARDTRELK